MDNGYILPGKVYDILKWVGLIILPALATLVQTVGAAVGFGYADVAATIITAVGAFIGAIIGASAAKAAKAVKSGGNQ